MNREKYSIFTAGINDGGKRADRVIRQFLPERSLGGIYKAFRKGLIRINGEKVASDRKIVPGDSLQIYQALLEDMENREERTSGGSDIAGRVIFEDEDLLAIGKKRGELVHGGEDSLEEKVRDYLKGKLSDSLSFRPGPLHRLDRNTSGLIFFSRSLKGAREFSALLQSGEMRKFYLALVDGRVMKRAFWTDNLQRDGSSRTSSVAGTGVRAKTTVIPMRCGRDRSLVIALIETGRTHQIRVQAAHHGHPLSGDSKYGGSPLKGGYILHCLAVKSSRGEKQPGGRVLTADPGAGLLKAVADLFPEYSAGDLIKDAMTIVEEM